MPVKLAFNFPLSLLSQEADSILDIAEANAALINPRLPANFVALQRTLLGTVRSDTTAQKGSRRT